MGLFMWLYSLSDGMLGVSHFNCYIPVFNCYIPSVELSNVVCLAAFYNKLTEVEWHFFFSTSSVQGLFESTTSQLIKQNAVCWRTSAILLVQLKYFSQSVDI